MSALGFVHGCIQADSMLVDVVNADALVKVGRLTFAGSEATKPWPVSPLPYRWLAPELLVANAAASSRTFATDVWAVSVMLWEILTAGSTPYSECETLEAILAEFADKKRMQVPLTASHDLRQLLTRCWRTEPEARLSMNQVKTRLDADGVSKCLGPPEQQDIVERLESEGLLSKLDSGVAGSEVGEGPGRTEPQEAEYEVPVPILETDGEEIAAASPSQALGHGALYHGFSAVTAAAPWPGFPASIRSHSDPPPSVLEPHLPQRANSIAVSGPLLGQYVVIGPGAAPGLRQQPAAGLAPEPQQYAHLSEDHELYHPLDSKFASVGE
jgi:serine/threonine protein kinase